MLVLGGYGVFGARLSRALAKDPALTVIVAGRSLAAATEFCTGLQATPVALDRDAPDLADRLAAMAPFAVIDAAGPFQAYGPDPYRLARAGLQAGAHVLDLSDDAGFTAGITALDGLARAKGLVALSGVSSVPALSSAAVAVLAQGVEDIHLIESTILPGNRAPRGVSVIRAILAQAGRPLALWRGGQWQSARGWSGLQRVTLALPGAALPSRPASLIGAPDLALFPQAFAARSVLFRAGLELGLMHHGLGLLARLAQWRLLALPPLARPLRWLADRLRPFGSDRGGMRVRVAGLASGQPVIRDWVLIAEAGDGPEVPAIPARVAVDLLRKGALARGARPCIGDLPLQALEAALRGHAIRTGQLETPAPGLFEQVLGAEFRALPEAVQDLHQLFDQRHWQGRAEVSRGTGLLSRLICRVFGFPPAASDIDVTVTMQRNGAEEIWTRNFAGRRFRSVMRARHGRMTERFGPLTFTLDLQRQGNALIFPVLSGRLGPLPLPRWLLPRSEARETADGSGVRFDVGLSLPLAGLLVRYQGWLKDVDHSRK